MKNMILSLLVFGALAVTGMACSTAPYNPECQQESTVERSPVVRQQCSEPRHSADAHIHKMG